MKLTKSQEQIKSRLAAGAKINFTKNGKVERMVWADTKVGVSYTAFWNLMRLLSKIGHNEYGNPYEYAKQYFA